MLFLKSNELKQEIEAAFAEVQYPGDENIYAEGVEDPDIEKRVLRFKGTHWHEVDSEVLRGLRDGFVFFTPEAFRFYLPAFLIEYINDPDENVVNSLAFALSFARRDNLKLYSSQQIKAINSFLRYMQKYPSGPVVEDIELWDDSL